MLSPISPRKEASHAYARSIEFLPKRTISYRTTRIEAKSPDRIGVFLHGLGGSSLNWTDLMLALEPQLTGYAVDLPGFGMSPPPRDGDYTPSSHARAVAEFILAKELGPVDLFGNSLGGAVALQLAARKPELVRSLTLISPALPSLYATKGNVHLPAMAIPGVGGCFLWRSGFTYNTDAFLRTLRGLFKTNTGLTGANRPWKLAERVTAPTLGIYGREDVLVSAKTAHRLTKKFPNSHVVVLPNTGHMAHSEHPEFVKAAWDRFLL